MPDTSVRLHCLTKETGYALSWTCSCSIDFCRYLLTTPENFRHEFILLQFFNQDAIENHFGHFRLSAGANYYLTLKDVLVTHSIDRARKLLEVLGSFEFESFSTVHVCDFCTKPLTKEEAILIDKPDMVVDMVSKEERNSLYFIAGFIAFKHTELSTPTYDLDDGKNPDTKYFDELSRDGLTFPCFQWYKLVLDMYTIFVNSNEMSCRHRLCNIFHDLIDCSACDWIVPSAAISRLVNILLKRYSQKSSEDYALNTMKHKRKIAKLSSS